MTNYADYYTIECGRDTYDDGTTKLDKAEETANELAHTYPGKTFMIIYHKKIKEYVEEAPDLDHGIVCLACGCTATIHKTAATKYKCPACGEEITDE